MSTETERMVRLDRGPFRRLAMRGHIATYRLTRGRKGAHIDGDAGHRPVLLLTTTGRTTGRKLGPCPSCTSPTTTATSSSAPTPDETTTRGGSTTCAPTPPPPHAIGTTPIAVTAHILTDTEAAPHWPALDRDQPDLPGAATTHKTTLPHHPPHPRLGPPRPSCPGVRGDRSECRVADR